MNHLVGLTFPTNDPLEHLHHEDASVLARFRQEFETHKPARTTTVPLTHQIVDSSDLPPCGWRPLDDATLYRFLCADRDKKGNFHPDLSMTRLRNALQFRRDHKVDEILNIEGSLYYNPPEEADLLLDESSTRSVCSGGSLLVGSFCSEHGNVIEVSSSIWKKQTSFSSSVTTADSTITLPSLSHITPAQLEQYQRLRVRVFVGHDKQGNPVLFERLGAFLGSGSNVHLFTQEEWIQLYVWDVERHLTEMRMASIRFGKPIQKYVYFADLSGVFQSVVMGTIWQVIPLVKVLAKTVEEHYPEIVSHIVLFNTPKVAQAVWEVVKKFLDPVTAAKVQLYSGFPKQQALEMMDPSVLPVEYGGTNTVYYPEAAKK